MWNKIETLPDENKLILAYVPPDKLFPEGRMMIWKASLLVRNLKGPTPNHLQFPATHWRELQAPVSLPEGTYFGLVRNLRRELPEPPDALK